MARRLPNCAYCGESLKDADCFQWMSPVLAGKPEVGWHTPGCAEQDPIRAGFPAPDRKALIRQLRTIEGRGPGRLVANKGWLKVVSSD